MKKDYPDGQMISHVLTETHRGGVHPKMVRVTKMKGPAGTRIVNARKKQHKQQSKSSRRMPFPRPDVHGFY